MTNVASALLMALLLSGCASSSRALTINEMLDWTVPEAKARLGASEKLELVALVPAFDLERPAAVVE